MDGGVKAPFDRLGKLFFQQAATKALRQRGGNRVPVGSEICLEPRQTQSQEKCEAVFLPECVKTKR
ncbi:hypothetical protein LB543_10230 [Mesorhizobium sp. ESP7-2]|uniref:hypothetical protein n=1 Tax=Mesorhizobium sp. ESP7-2 TaxID=2876622 RepID=UPI001CCD20D0|nr:hypothetical protein [Mesorhizobium sp. ESP7-2]MBZ9707097.1 hypothetical protein [Mesorhizobium sp. ESP7-2]